MAEGVSVCMCGGQQLVAPGCGQDQEQSTPVAERNANRRGRPARKA